MPPKSTSKTKVKVIAPPVKPPEPLKGPPCIHQLPLFHCHTCCMVELSKLAEDMQTSRI